MCKKKKRYEKTTRSSSKKTPTTQHMKEYVSYERRFTLKKPNQ
jgi:hypothetical protein